MEKVESAWKFPEITPRRMEFMLQIYGMSKKIFANLFDKSPAWMDNVFFNQKVVTLHQLEVFIEQVGWDVWQKLIDSTAHLYGETKKNENEEEN